MENIPMRISEDGMQPMILQAAKQYRRPLKALREYVTNSIDAYVGSQDRGIVNVGLSRKANVAIVSDYASGMNESTMRTLPENIGNSIKRGRVDMRGEKAVGLVAFGSMGNKLDLISRTRGDKGYNHLRYKIVGSGLDERIEAEFGRLTQEDLDTQFYGGFEQGTKAIVKVNPEIFDRQFKPGEVRKFIQQTYMPLFFRGSSGMFFLDDLDSGEQRVIEAPKLDGNILINSSIPFNAGKGDSRPVKFQLNFDPDAMDASPSLFSKDVLVYEAVAQMDDRLAKMPLWSCRQVNGFVNEPALSLTLGRDGINQNSREYQEFFELLKRVNDELVPELEARADNVAKKRAHAYVSKAWEVLSDTIAEVYDPLEKGTRPPGPESDVITDPNSDYIPEGDPHTNGRKRKRRGVPFQGLVIKDFGLSSRSQRSALDDVVGKPSLLVNSSHRDYRENVSTGSRMQALQYLVDISSDPIAMYQTEKAVEERKIPNDERMIAQEVARRAQTIRIEANKRIKGGKKNE